MTRVIVAGALALAFSGCAEFDRLTMVLGAPQTSRTFENLRTGATALVCSLSAAAALAGRVEAAISAGDAAVTGTGKVYVASAIVCDTLGGVVTGASVVR